jgi:hypothetical protein
VLKDTKEGVKEFGDSGEVYIQTLRKQGICNPDTVFQNLPVNDFKSTRDEDINESVLSWAKDRGCKIAVWKLEEGSIKLKGFKFF